MDNYSDDEEQKNENQFTNANKDNLKMMINAQLDKMGLYEKIKKMTENSGSKNEEEVMQKIKETGLVDEIMASFNEAKNKEKNKNIQNINLNKIQYDNSLKLFLKLNKASNFIDYENQNLLDQNTSHSPSYFVFDIQFFGQRFHTKKIQTGSQFIIDESFLLDFNPLNLEYELNYNILRKINSPIHIVILLYNASDNSTKIISSKSIEWRWVLCYGNYKIETEFKSPSSLNNVNVGTVEMTLSLIPLLDKSNLLSQNMITDQLNDERKSEIEKTQDFIQYASLWWEDYKSIRPGNSNRIVKLFLPTEDRENYSYKPAPSLIESISSGRVINTPFEAARFVSLIPFERRENPGGEKIEIWHSMHSFLSLMKGDVEDHVILLCNLLIGFGLNAFIVSGIAVNGPHLWVLSRNKISDKKFDVTFWESLTGQRVKVDDPKVFRFYKKIHCVWNDKCFYGNIQKDDSVFNTIYYFEDETLWKSIAKEKIESLPKYSITPILDIINVDKFKIENDIEKILKNKIAKYRNSIELKTVFDMKLAHLISPALVNYEMERVTNLTYGNEEFKQSVKNNVPEGFTFKAYPFQINDLDTEKMFHMIENNDVGIDILNSRGDQVQFAVRCKLYPYPQNVYSCWIMIAVKYRVVK